MITHILNWLNRIPQDRLASIAHKFQRNIILNSINIAFQMTFFYRLPRCYSIALVLTEFFNNYKFSLYRMNARQVIIEKKLSLTAIRHNYCRIRNMLLNDIWSNTSSVE